MPMYLHSHALFLVPQYFHRGATSVDPAAVFRGVNGGVGQVRGFMGWDTGMYKKFYNIE